MSVDIIIRDKLRQCVSMETSIRLVRTDSPGRPPRLSHSSWTMDYDQKSYCLYLPRLVASGMLFPFVLCVFASSDDTMRLLIKGSNKYMQNMVQSRRLLSPAIHRWAGSLSDSSWRSSHSRSRQRKAHLFIFSPSFCVQAFRVVNASFVFMCKYYSAGLQIQCPPFNWATQKWHWLMWKRERTKYSSQSSKITTHTHTHTHTPLKPPPPLLSHSPTNSTSPSRAVSLIPTLSPKSH